MSRSWGRLARPLTGLVVLGLVVVGVDPTSVVDGLAGTHVALALVGVLGLTASHLVPAVGWRAILGTMSGLWLPWRAALVTYYAAQAIGGVTPANLGGDVHRAGALRRSGHGWSTAVAPLLVQRATSYLALGALAVVSLAFLAVRTPLAGWIVLAGVGAAAVVGFVAWLLLAPPPPLHGAHARLTRRFGGAAVPEGEHVGLGPAMLIGAAQGLGFHAAAIGLIGLLVVAVDPATPIGLALAVLAVARLALAVPLTPSGLGVQEGAAAALFATLGLAPGVALAAMLLARLSLLLTTLIGVLLLQRPERLPAVAEPTAGYRRVVGERH